MVCQLDKKKRSTLGTFFQELKWTIIIHQISELNYQSHLNGDSFQHCNCIIEAAISATTPLKEEVK